MLMPSVPPFRKIETTMSRVEFDDCAITTCGNHVGTNAAMPMPLAIVRKSRRASAWYSSQPVSFSSSVIGQYH